MPHIVTTTFQYDIIENVEKGHWGEEATDPKGNKTLKVYDKAGRLTKVTVDNKTTEYTYYNNGARSTIKYPDGSKEEYTYYKNNLLKTLINKKADGSIIDSYSYEYDKAKNQIKKTDNKGTTQYTYDKLNRLKTVKENTTLVENRTTEYTYDKAGNRKTESIAYQGETTQTTYNYNKQNRLLNTIKTANSKKVEERNQYDEQTDTYYCMARMYDPNIARFLSEDTYTGDINNPLSLNLYTYCHNNPITYYDPTGHFIDIIADIGFIVLDVVDIVKDPTDWKNWSALGMDEICAIVPVATGGGRALKAADKAYDTVKKVSKTKKFLKSTKVVGKKVIKDVAIEF